MSTEATPPTSPTPLPPSPVAPTRASSRGLYTVGLLGLTLAAGSVAALATRRSHAETREAEARRALVAAGPRVRAVPVARASAERTLTLPGEVRAWSQATLYAKVSGYLRDIRVDKGDRVTRGQVLATLESPEADQQVAAAQADVEVKRQLLQRHRALVVPGVSSQQQVDDAEAALKIAEAALARARATQDYGTIQAPFEGVVTARYVDPGALLPAATGSTQNAQPVVDVANMDKLRVSIYLGQDDAAAVREGDPVTLTVDQRPGQTLEAKVTRMARSLDSRTRTMLCEVELDNEQLGLYPGSFVHATLHLKASPWPQVPAEALISRGNTLYVAVVEEKKARLVPVKVGQHDGRTARILSGLKGGELVALNAGSEVTDGGPVDAVVAKAERP